VFYWILEYVKVLAVYLFIMYLWPSAVFRNYLSQKGVAFRFSFCTTFMILLLNSAVLMLGVVKLLNPWIVRVLFYGPLIYIVGKWLWRNRGAAIHIKYLLTDICSLKRFVSTAFSRVGIAVRDAAKKIYAAVAPNFMVYLFLAVLVVYGMIYFSYGAFHEKYYGTSDVYVHHRWIDMLLDGQIFGAGVYPEGMHCFIYAMHTLFGVKVYSCMLFLSGIHISAFLVSVYLFFREIFPWKFTGIFVLLLYLILRLDSSANIVSMSRFQWTIPQEFAMFSVFLCGAYLLRFLRNMSGMKLRWKRWEFVRDENLLVFSMALAVSIAVHFYVTIFAFFLCCAIGIFFLYWAIVKKQIVPLLSAILCGAVIAMTPMLAALATGMEFQGSIGWAMGVISASQDAMKDETVQDDAIKNPDADSTPVDSDDSLGNFENPYPVVGEDTQEPTEELPEPKEPLISKFYRSSLAVIYTDERAALFASCILFGGLLGTACRILSVLKRKNGVGDDPFCGYLILVTASLIFLLLYAAPALGMLEIVQSGRLCTMAHLLTIATIMIPLDWVMLHVGRFNRRFLENICVGLIGFSICTVVILLGEYHGYLFNYISRYPSVVDVTKQITNDMEPQSYTVVAAFDELYHVKEYGFHEEAVRFIHEMTEESYTLPTEYVFIYLEKQPLVYAHVHFFEGPAWLAKEEYTSVINYASQSPDFRHSDISDAYADKDISVPIHFNSYTSLELRTVIYSRLNRWVERFKELYPYQLTTVYEDDAVVCYMFRQNPARLLELAIID